MFIKKKNSAVKSTKRKQTISLSIYLSIYLSICLDVINTVEKLTAVQAQITNLSWSGPNPST